MKTVEAGYTVRFMILETLMTRVVRAERENRLPRQRWSATATRPNEGISVRRVLLSDRGDGGRAGRQAGLLLGESAGVMALVQRQYPETVERVLWQLSRALNDEIGDGATVCITLVEGDLSWMTSVQLRGRYSARSRKAVLYDHARAVCGVR